MTLEIVRGLCLHTILSKLGPNDAASVSSVSRGLRISVSEDDSLWSKFCSDELELDSPVDPVGNPVPSFKIAYRAWREAFRIYPWSLVIRAKRCWNRIKIWLAANFPEVLDTLHSGANEDEIMALEMRMKIKLPLPTRILYRFCNGQEVNMDEVSGRTPRNLLGLIGGFKSYNTVNVFLLPLELVALKTKRIIPKTRSRSRSEYIVVAESYSMEKIFFLDCSNGQLYVGTMRIHADGEMLPCVPDSLISSVHDPQGSQVQDAMLLWMEELGRQLEHGIIKVRQSGNIRGINHFPEVLPLCQTAVSYGVKVRGSAVFVPQLSSFLDDESRECLFAYSFRMSLLPEGCIINGMNFSSCQLHSRRFEIWINDTFFESQSLVGEYPFLHQGKEEFVSESCRFLPSQCASMEGYFTFVPGRALHHFCTKDYSPQLHK